MSDPRIRELASATWNAASRLFRLMDQWRKWYWDLRIEGHADRELPSRLRWGCETCIRILCDSGLDFGKPEELLSFIPFPPGISLDPPGQIDAAWLKHAGNAVGVSGYLQGSLNEFLRRLEEAPGFMFADQIRGPLPSPHEPFLDKSLLDRVQIASGATPKGQQSAEPSNHDTGAVMAPTNRKPDEHEVILSRLRLKRAPIQAALFDAMQDQNSISFLDVAHQVHGNNETSKETIRQNMSRLNQSMIDLEIPLRFRSGGEHVHKERLPE